MIPLLSLTSVHKRFAIAGNSRSVFAVNDISLAITSGQTLALVGESGSGKTTAGRIIAGLETVSEGKLEFEGADIAAQRKRGNLGLDGQIQMVFQEPAEQLDPRLTVGVSLAEPLTNFRISRKERNARVAEVMDMVAMPSSLLGSLPGDLSAGLQQRVGIARAIITKPKLIVLDEPTSALDPSARADIIALLNRIQKETGTAYLFISHDLSTVRFASDRAAVMYLGMIVEEGPTASLFANPRHPYSRALLGAVLLPNPVLVPKLNVKLAGEIPSPINLPKGCFLASRCPFAIAQCREAIPPVERVSDSHTVRCIRHAELGEEIEGNDLYQQFQREAERILSVGAPRRETLSLASAET